jgi:hypothetical protein
MGKVTVIKPKRRCCNSRPRCKRCPVVCDRLVKAGVATKLDNGSYALTVTLRKKQIKKQMKAARAR